MKKISIILFIIPTLFLCSCNKFESNAEYSVPENVEIIEIDADRALCHDLSKIEEQSDIIIRGIVSENIGQDYETSYDYELKKDLPSNGWTDWSIDVKEVYKGSFEKGDKIVFRQDYYLLKNPDGKTQLVTMTCQKPVKIGEEYLLFLQKPLSNEIYYATGDHEGVYSVSDKLITKSKSLTFSDLNMYENDEYSYMFDLYKKVSEKYLK